MQASICISSPKYWHLGWRGWASSTATIFACNFSFSDLEVADCLSEANFLANRFLVDLWVLGDKIYLSLKTVLTASIDK